MSHSHPFPLASAVHLQGASLLWGTQVVASEVGGTTLGAEVHVISSFYATFTLIVCCFAASVGRLLMGMRKSHNLQSTRNSDAALIIVPIGQLLTHCVTLIALAYMLTCCIACSHPPQPGNRGRTFPAGTPRGALQGGGPRRSTGAGNVVQPQQRCMLFIPHASRAAEALWRC
jgi:hypothetical protein